VSLRYLLDTDWVIDHFNGVEAVTRRLEEFRPAGLALSVISLAELYEGVHYDVCDLFGRERGKLRQRGRLIGDFDLLIAATCWRRDEATGELCRLRHPSRLITAHADAGLPATAPHPPQVPPSWSSDGLWKLATQLRSILALRRITV
jgi:tRNA(fMet)-specific endonuclease VapC